MPRNKLERIREYIRLGNYDMTAHAMEEMAEDFWTLATLNKQSLPEKSQ